MIKIGMLIADRYEVLEKVGTGGMSDVYKAKDHRLNRMVAVKVLKQEFSENATFVSKFRAEAQAAAGLMHPNIVNVYDVGDEKSSYYIIMELVNGITLKKYIEKKGKLSPREAVTVAIQVSMGLAAAHRGHIIHRDIKPQNIIISKEGKVKVTDFGIAKASTSNTITSNVMGSVHYTSPEQARGGYSDEKSDVYSLGVTLFEMLTGRVPYEGDTTVAIALKHIQEPFPDPASFVPDLPRSVQQIVLKCCEKSPDRRYQTMDELAADLRHSLNDPDGNFVKRMGEENLAETRTMSETDREEIRRKSSALAGDLAAAAAGQAGTVEKSAAAAAGAAGAGPETKPSDRGGRDKTGAESAPGRGSGEKKKAVPAPESPDEVEIEEGERRLDRLVQVLSVVAVLVIGLVIILVALNRREAAEKKEAAEREAAQQAAQAQAAQTQTQTQPVTQQAAANMTVMPAVVGRTLEDAQADLANAGLGAEVLYGVSDMYDEGIVMEAGAAEGQQIPVGSTVTLTVARIERVQIPDVIDFAREEAEATLQQTGLVPVVEEIFTEEVDAGFVTGQAPEGGGEAPVGSEVVIYVSKGPDLTGLVQVPNLLGMTEQQAAAELLQAGLVAGQTTVTDTSGRYAPDTVIGQSIEKGEYVEEGTQVDMDVSGDPLYTYSARIEAPRNSEDPDYQEGTPVTLVIVTEGENSEEILNATTTTFPFPVSITGITASRGTLYMTYTNIVRDEAPAGATDGGFEETTEFGETKEITRELTFTKEE